LIGIPRDSGEQIVLVHGEWLLQGSAKDAGAARTQCCVQASQTATGSKSSASWNFLQTVQFVFPSQARFLACSSFGRLKMSLINVVIALVVVGVILWLINNYLPMDGKIKNILNIVVVIAVVLWLLRAFGLLSSLGSM
jgi:hypothetical protein